MCRPAVAPIFWPRPCFSMPSSEQTITKFRADRRVGRRIPTWSIIEFDYPAKRKVSGRAHVGVVGSGDLEVLLEPAEGEQFPGPHPHERGRLSRDLESRVDRFFTRYDGAVRIEINDAGATPGSVQLRLEQAVEVSEHESRERRPSLHQPTELHRASMRGDGLSTLRRGNCARVGRPVRPSRIALAAAARCYAAGRRRLRRHERKNIGSGRPLWWPSRARFRAAAWEKSPARN